MLLLKYMPHIRRILCAALILPVCLAGDTPSSDWDEVRALTNGTRVRLDLIEERTVQGTVLNVSATAIALSVGGTERLLPRRDVARIYQILPKKRGRRTKIGAAVGAGVETSVGAATAFDAIAHHLGHLPHALRTHGTGHRDAAAERETGLSTTCPGTARIHFT